MKNKKNGKRKKFLMLADFSASIRSGMVMDRVGILKKAIQRYGDAESVDFFHFQKVSFIFPFFFVLFQLKYFY